MKRIVSIGALLVLALGTAGCTEKQLAREYGGTTTIEVPADKQLINITWKEGSTLWVLTKDRAPGHVPQTYYFEEDSAWGVFEGKVVIVEK